MSEMGTLHSMFSGAKVRTWVLIVGILATIILYFLAWAYPTFPGDEATLIRLQSFRNEWLDETAVIFENLGALGCFAWCCRTNSIPCLNPTLC